LVAGAIIAASLVWLSLELRRPFGAEPG